MGLLATVAIVFVIGVIAAAVRVIRNKERPRATQETVAPTVSTDLKPEVLPAGTPDENFWRLFTGDTDKARLLREGGRLSTRSGKRITVHKVGDLTVIVVAASRGADEVKRYVCSRTDGHVFKQETRRPSEGHINIDQARDTNRQGMKTLPDIGLEALMVDLLGCYRTP